MHDIRCQTAASLVLIALLAAGSVDAQSRAAARLEPPPPGREIAAADGDVVVVDGDARVGIVRRREAEVRVVSLPESRAMLVLADWDAPGAPAGVDRVWRFNDVDGQWPLEARWQGRARLFESDPPLRGDGAMLAIETPAGRVEFRSRGGASPAPSRAAAVITFTGMSGGGEPGLTFDDAERHAAMGTFIPSFAQASATAGATWMAEAPSFQLARPDARAAALTAAKPRLTHRVEPHWPTEATGAGAQGLVLIELAVGLDGAVRDARVLRSVPLLDAAALAATRQWRYEPAGPEGRPDPMIVTVAFSLPARRW